MNKEKKMYPASEADTEVFEEPFRTLFYTSPNPSVVVEGSSLSILIANEAAGRLFGYRPEELVSQGLLELFLGSDRESIREKLGHPGLGPEKTGPWTLRKNDGRARYVEVALQPYAIGERPVVVVRMHDVTSRVEMEQSAIASEQRYREIFENANDLIYTHDLKGTFITFNQAAERATGYLREDAASLDIARVVAPEYLELARGMIRRKLGGEKPTTYELEIMAKDGRRIPIEVSTRIQFVDGNPVAVQGIARDITERRRARQELENYTVELQLKNRELASALEAARFAAEAKSRFLANVSHETRTPMNGIIGMIHLLLETPLGPEQRDYAETVLQSANNLLAIMNDILDFSKIEAGRMTLETTAFSLLEVIQGVLKLFSGRAAERNLELKINVAAGLPALVTGDCLRLQQILMNLISNAIKFTHRGTVTLAAGVVETREDDSMVKFTVTDTGIGIRTEVLERIFESFVQADDSNTRLYGGTGLGLSISRQLAELMGGKIGVNSEFGKGSTFWFTVPLGHVSEAGEGESH